MYQTYVIEPFEFTSGPNAPYPSPHISFLFYFYSLDNKDLEFIDRSAFGRLVVHSICVLISKTNGIKLESYLEFLLSEFIGAFVHAPCPIIININLYSHLKQI